MELGMLQNYEEFSNAEHFRQHLRFSYAEDSTNLWIILRYNPIHEILVCIESLVKKLRPCQRLNLENPAVKFFLRFAASVRLDEVQCRLYLHVRVFGWAWTCVVVFVCVLIIICKCHQNNSLNSVRHKLLTFAIMSCDLCIFDFISFFLILFLSDDEERKETNNDKMITANGFDSIQRIKKMIRELSIA